MRRKTSIRNEHGDDNNDDEDDDDEATLIRVTRAAFANILRKDSRPREAWPKNLCMHTRVVLPLDSDSVSEQIAQRSDLKLSGSMLLLSFVSLFWLDDRSLS